MPVGQAMRIGIGVIGYSRFFEEIRLAKRKGVIVSAVGIPHQIMAQNHGLKSTIKMATFNQWAKWGINR